MMNSSESLLSVEIESVDQKLCVICNSSIKYDDQLELNFMKKIENSNVLFNPTYQEINLFAHKNCINFEKKINKNSMIYFNNLKKNYKSIIMLLFLLILIIMIVICDCYFSINLENYLSTNCGSYDISTWMYQIHVVLIMNVILILIIGLIFIFKILLLTFWYKS